MAKHYVIYVPGLGDRAWRKVGQAWLIHSWRWSFNIAADYHIVGWSDRNGSYEAKLNQLLERIDAGLHENYTVSLVASSAGATLALQAFAARRGQIHRVVLIAGKVNNPDNVDELIYKANPIARPALQNVPAALKQLSASDRNKILIVKPQEDRVVPLPDMDVDGAQYLHLPVRGHVLAIFMSLTIFSTRIIRFIKS